MSMQLQCREDILIWGAWVSAFGSDYDPRVLGSSRIGLPQGACFSLSLLPAHASSNKQLQQIILDWI